MSAYTSIPLRVCGVRSQRDPLPPSDAPRLWGCDRGGVRESRGLSAPLVALRGRIQAHNAWNLLRPPRDAALLVLAIERLVASPGALLSPILAETHTCFIVLGTLRALLYSLPVKTRIRIISSTRPIPPLGP